MDLLFNELSLHGQFPDLSTFETAVERVMSMRKLTARFGCELYCHRNVANALVTPDVAVPKAVGAFEPNRRRALMGDRWLVSMDPSDWLFTPAPVDDRGERTPEGHRLYQKHFTGDKAWFSDSSDTEKARFRTELTFPNPSARGGFLFCPWHGKVKTPQLRIHFSWPIRAGEPLCVVYVGPKITKR